MKKMIDVSKWQGVIDWETVKKQGISDVIIKIGGSDAGLYQDPMFISNYEDAKSNGFKIGIYYFVGPAFLNKSAGQTTAKEIIKLLDGRALQHPIYIDIEKAQPTQKKATTEALNACLEYLKSKKYVCGVYGSDISTFKNMLELTDIPHDNLWVASYGYRPKYVDGYMAWQYTGTGKVKGISVNVDISELYDTPYTTKSLTNVVLDVINGKYGNGEERTKKLKAAGYDPVAVQSEVNKYLKGR